MNDNGRGASENSREQELIDLYGKLVTEATTHSWKNFQFMMRGAILMSGASVLTAVNFTASDTVSFSDVWVSILLFAFAFFFSLAMNLMVFAVESDRADHYFKELQSILSGRKSAYDFMGYGFNAAGKKKYFWIIGLYVLALVGGWAWLAPHV